MPTIPSDPGSEPDRPASSPPRSTDPMPTPTKSTPRARPHSSHLHHLHEQGLEDREPQASSPVQTLRTLRQGSRSRSRSMSRSQPKDSSGSTVEGDDEEKKHMQLHEHVKEVVEVGVQEYSDQGDAHVAHEQATYGNRNGKAGELSVIVEESTEGSVSLVTHHPQSPPPLPPALSGMDDAPPGASAHTRAASAPATRTPKAAQIKEQTLPQRPNQEHPDLTTWNESEISQAYTTALQPLKEREEELQDEWARWTSVYDLWTNTSMMFEEDRARKRIRTRLAFVDVRQRELEERKAFLEKVVGEFERVVGLLG